MHDFTPVRLLIFGYGYVAQHLIEYIKDFNWIVHATTRNPESHEPLKQAVTLLDYNQQSNIESHIKHATHILVTIPPDKENGDVVLAQFKNCILNEAQSLKWIGYLSSTSVYGDHQGDWVDEESTCYPDSHFAINRYQAENNWISLFNIHALPIHIFRLAGIYGPNRNIFEKIKAGKQETIIKEDQFFSRIHVTDICMTLAQSMLNVTPGEYYNLADDLPAPLHEVECLGAKLLGCKLKIIPFERAELSKMAQAFFKANKKINNHKVKQILKLKWNYPNYKLGLTREFNNLK